MSNQPSDPTSRGATPDGPHTEPSAETRSEQSTEALAQPIVQPTPPGVPLALAELDLTSLIGRTLAEARAEVQARGGVVRAVEPGGVITLDYRPNRVTLTVADDRVSAVTGIG